MLHASWADRAVWAATVGLTVFADLTVAVEVGMVLAAFLYIRQVTETTSVEPVTDEYIKDGRPHVLQDKPIPSYVTILRIHGPFLFGASRQAGRSQQRHRDFRAVVILRLRNMTALDGTGLHALEAFAKRVLASERSLVICGTRKQPFKLIRHSKIFHIIGKENVVPHVEAALARAQANYAGFGGIVQHAADGLGEAPSLRSPVKGLMRISSVKNCRAIFVLFGCAVLLAVGASFLTAWKNGGREVEHSVSTEPNAVLQSIRSGNERFVNSHRVFSTDTANDPFCA